jgi:hypothetical protein
MQDNYEKQLFNAMADYVKENTQKVKVSDENLLLQSLHLTYYLGRSRSFIFKNKKIHSIESSLIHPVTVDLMTANGACGSYAYILSRLLNELNIPNRIAQMKVGGLYGGHILVEAKIADKWVVLDGSYDLCFKKRDGSLASFEDVQTNWDYYRSQVPANYDSHYRYEGVRYTNWNKIPVVMPLIKNILYLIMGKEKAEGFSLRILFLRKFLVLFLITAFVYLLLIVTIFSRYIHKNRQAITIYFPVLLSGKRIPSFVTDESIKNRA